MPTPMDGIHFIHNAIRGDTQYFQDSTDALGSADAGEVANFEERFQFFREAVKEHEEAEESAVFSLLEPKVPHLGPTYAMDHRANDAAVDNLEAALKALQSAAGSGERAASVAQLSAQATALNTLMSNHLSSNHLSKEEQLLLPILNAQFSIEEQSTISEKIQENIPPEKLMSMLVWVFKANDLDSREEFLQMLKEEMPPPVSAGASQVMKGAVSAEEWAQATQNLPELA